MNNVLIPASQILFFISFLFCLKFFHPGYYAQKDIKIISEKTNQSQFKE